MAQKSLYELTLDINANSAKYVTGLREAQEKTEKFRKSVSVQMALINQSFGLLEKGSNYASKVLNFLKVGFESTQMTGDALEIKIAGIKDVGQTVAQSLASMDFSVSLRDAKKAAEEYAAILDDLGDRRRSMDIISAKNASEVAKLKGQLKDTTLSEEKRLAVSKRIQEIAEDELKLRKDIASEAFGGIVEKNISKYGITKENSELLINYVQDYAKYSKAQQDALNSAMEAQKKLDVFTTNNSENISRGLYDIEAYKKNQQDVVDLTALVAPGLQKYVVLWRPLNDLTDEQRDSIKNISIEWYNATTAIQNYINSAERVENKLNSKTIKREEPPTKANTSNLKIPTLGTPFKIPNTLAPSNAKKNKIINETEEIQNQADVLNLATDAVNALNNAFDSLFEGTEGGFKSIVTVVLESTRQILMAKFAEAVAGVIAGESNKGLLGVATAAIGVGLITALWKSKIPKFATGTDYAPGGLALVGERGPELVNLPRGSQVIPNSKLPYGGTETIKIEVEGKIKGRDIHLAQKRYTSNLNYTT